MYSRRLITAGFIVLSMVATTYVAVVSANHSWESYHWERSNSGTAVSLTVGKNGLGSSWIGSFDHSVGHWDSGSSVLSLNAVRGKAKGSCRPGNGRIEVCAGSYGYTQWLGVAQIWISGDHITKANARMNDSYMGEGSGFAYDDPEWRQLVMCQEIGHTFGLDHQDETFDNPNLGTCMDYTDFPTTNQHPNQHDWNELLDIYEHAHSDDEGGGARETAKEGAVRTCRHLPWGRSIWRHRRSGGGLSARLRTDAAACMSWTSAVGTESSRMCSGPIQRSWNSNRVGLIARNAA